MATQAPATVTLQGIVVPGEAVNPKEFFARTRRQNLLMKSLGATAGFGGTDIVEMLQTGILSRVQVKVSGTLTVTVPSGGSVATTYLWPYNYLKQARLSANGQSNLIALSGWQLKAFQLADRNPKDDRGVQNAIGGAFPGTTRNQGTLAMASESWGVGQGVTAIPAGSYDVEMTVELPIAYDQATLLGAIFAQTTSTNLELSLDWEQQANLFTLAGGATVAFTPSAIVEGTVYSIPANPQGGIFVPNLSAFHSLVASRAPNSISVGNNEITLAGQGVGRQLMRLGFRTWSNGAPLSMSAANYSQIYWRYGGNTTPEQWFDGHDLRAWDEAIYNVDMGAYQGYGFLDFSSIWAFRDSIDEGAASQLRFGFSIPNGVSLTNPSTEYVSQTIVAGAVAA